MPGRFVARSFVHPLIPLIGIMAVLSGCVAPRSAPPPAPRPQAPPPTQVRQQPSTPPPFEASRVVPNAVETRGGTYVVGRGDTLRRISDKTGAASEAIARLNNLSPPFLIRLGQKLRIPAGRWHHVRAGETGIAIARAYGVEWERISALNQLEQPFILRVGQRLLLPSETEVANMTMEQRAAAFSLDIEDLISGGEPALAERESPARPSSTEPLRKPLPPTEAVAAARPFSGSFSWPLTGPIKRGYGTFGSGRRNDGINIGANMGTPIAAAGEGVVVYAGTELAAYGGLILIRHNDTYTTAYGNASELLVTRGQAVRQGQIIAKVGESGHVDSPQLHFQIRKGTKPIDPLSLLPKRG